MGWERRGSRVYLYRKRRIGQRVVSEYVGNGTLGTVLAGVDSEAKRLRDEMNVRIRAHRKKVQDIDSELVAVMRRTTRLMAVLLRREGYHQHKGTWRKRRG